MTKDTSTSEPDQTKETEQAELPAGPKYMSKPDDARPKPKRFYKEVSVTFDEELYNILLDGRIVKTPMKTTFGVKTEALAKAIAAEWEAQVEVIDSETMILTKLANTGIDRVATRRGEIIAELTSYGGSDLVCYRAVDPFSLADKERQIWDPFLDWFKSEHNISFKLGTGIVHVAQDAEDLVKFSALYDRFDEFELTALHNITTMVGSAVLPISLVLGDWSFDDVWTAAHVEEDFQKERWGTDEQAEARREGRFKEFQKTYEFYKLASTS